MNEQNFKKHMNGHGLITIWNGSGQEISYEYRGIGNNKVVLAISFWREDENYLEEFQGEISQVITMDEAWNIYQILKTAHIGFNEIDKVF